MKFEIVAIAALSASAVQGATLLETVVNSAALSTLEQAVLAASASIATALNNSAANYTVFAPSDAAFLKVNDLLPYLTSKAAYQQGLLDKLLTSHVVSGITLAANITSTTVLPTLNTGFNLTFNTTGGVFVNGNKVSTANVIASNGVAHVIDGVIVPPGFPTQNIAQLVIAQGENYTTLVTALTALNLNGTVVNLASVNDTFTLFAPTNAAIAAALTSLNVTVEALLGSKKLLTQVLGAHVVSGKAILAKDLEASFKTVSGETIKSSQIKPTKADVAALNGIVHFVSAVIVPPSLQAPAPVAAPSGASTVSVALFAAALLAAVVAN